MRAKLILPYGKGFFAARTNHRPTNRVRTTARPSTSTATATASTGLSTTTAVLIADPTSLRRELDERMKKLESEGADYRWLDQRKVSSCYWINGMLNYRS
jgi:hypothetical protein